MSTDTIQMSFKVKLKSGRRGQKRVVKASAKDDASVPTGRVPRISRLMALAIHYDRLLTEGHVRSHHELSRLTGMDRSQLSRILNLRLLAPAIQEKLLFLPEITSGNDDIHLADMAKIWRERDWGQQWEIFS